MNISFLFIKRVQRFTVIFLIFSCLSVTSQNKKFRYGLKEIPQSLLENPGGEVNFDKHIGVPFLSGVYINVATSNKLISSLFANGVTIKDQYQSIINELNPDDFITANEQIEVFNFGYRLKNTKDYLSFGFYQELDFVAYHPKDISILYYQKNIEPNKQYNANQINYKSELFGVFHVGISKKINTKLTVGARAKFYLGAYNVQSLKNKGKITKTLDQNNEPIYTLEDVDASIFSSGISGLSYNNYLSKAIKNELSFGNLGLGIDLGFTYHLREDLTLTGSVLDLGFINYAKDITTYQIKSEPVDAGLIIPPLNQTNDLEYLNWKGLTINSYPKNSIDTLNTSYTSFRAPKIYTSLFYNFGKDFRKNRSCSSVSNLNYREYLNEVGLQFYSIFRPVKPQFAGSLFYSRRFSKFLKAKVTYTVDSYSFYNIGLGFSTQFGKFNFYASADNLLGITDIYNSKKVSMSLGMNFIFE